MLRCLGKILGWELLPPLLSNGPRIWRYIFPPFPCRTKSDLPAFSISVRKASSAFEDPFQSYQLAVTHDHTLLLDSYDHNLTRQHHPRCRIMKTLAAKGLAQVIAKRFSVDKGDRAQKDHQQQYLPGVYHSQTRGSRRRLDLPSSKDSC